MPWEIPSNLHPPDTLCIQLQIPDDRGYIDAFVGAMLLLSQWTNWRRDGTNNAAIAASVMRDVFATMQWDNCIQPPPIPILGSLGVDIGDDELIRQDPDNPCLLQSSVDGVNWCTFADLSKCFSNPTPGPGTPQPTPGTCQTYRIQLNANGTAILPYPINSGDKVTLLSADGATTDGTGVWYCPSGQIFFGGACVGPTRTVSTDPINTFGHMAPILNLNGTFVALPIGTPVIIGAGVVGVQGSLQANDNSLSDDGGILTLQIEVCNELTPPPSESWCFTFDFTASDGGFVQAGGGAGNAIYSPGVGWTAPNFFFMMKQVPLPGATLHQVDAVATGSLGLKGNLYTSSDPTALDQILPINFTVGGGAFTDVDLPVGFWIGIFDPTGSDAPTVSSLTLRGHGRNPFGTDNCV